MYASVICDEILVDELQYNFATRLDDLVQFGKRTFEIRLDNEKGLVCGVIKTNLEQK